MTVIEISHLSKSYGPIKALDDISFTVQEREIVGLLGPNGAGKTTTLEILEGYRKPDTGKVTVLGSDPDTADRAWRSQIGLVLQSTSLDDELTVKEILGFYGGLYPDPRPVDEVLSMVKLSKQSDNRVNTLSGGQRRRLDFAAGIIGRPKILFLDEPTTGFDPAARHEAWDMIKSLCTDGTTVLLTTHYLEEASYLSDRVVIIDKGNLIADASPDYLRQHFSTKTKIHFPQVMRQVLAEIPSTLGPLIDMNKGESEISTENLTETLSTLAGWASARSIKLDGMTIEKPSLEEVYLSLTEKNHVSV